jgi:ankyrin repeat protein
VLSRPQEEPALLKASKAGDADRVSRLLANGHDPTIRDTKGRTPYQLAANKEVGLMAG